jgi:Protein of unknown function (DUF2752).
MLIGFPCLFHLLTGLYCPGCGGTRAVIYLFQGQFAASFRYHPFVIYAAAAVAVILLDRIAERFVHKRYLQLKHYTMLTYAGFGIVALNCIIKNYYLVARGIDLLP